MNTESEQRINNMVTDRLNVFTLELSEHLTQTVNGAVNTAVNGKIDKMAKSIEPMLKFFNNYTLARQMFWGGFKFISAIGATIVAIGGAWVFLKPLIIRAFIK